MVKSLIVKLRSSAIFSCFTHRLKFLHRCWTLELESHVLPFVYSIVGLSVLLIYAACCIGRQCLSLVYMWVKLKFDKNVDSSVFYLTEHHPAWVCSGHSHWAVFGPLVIILFTSTQRAFNGFKLYRNTEQLLLLS